MLAKELNGRMSFTMTTLTAATIGFLVGTFFPACSLSKFQITSRIFSYGGDTNSSLAVPIYNSCVSCEKNTNTFSSSTTNYTDDKYKIFVQSNPKGAEMLPPDIVVSETDLYQRRLWGDPNEDLPIKPKYLVAFAVSWKQKDNVNAAVQKFSENFTILLFHYDGHVNEWDEFEWSRRAIHIGTRKQTKWWYAKRFLHPDIVARYEYIFIWDEDLGVENFDAEEYIKLVKKYGLEISQPALESKKDFAYQITKRRNDTEAHKRTDDIQSNYSDLNQPPYTEFIEIMAPVFSKDAWRCVWHMIQNDLIHGWGLDFTLRKCVEPAGEKMGVVDAQWIYHHAVTTLKDQGKGNSERAATRKGIEDRCYLELRRFGERWHQAERSYYKMKGEYMSMPRLTTVTAAAIGFTIGILFPVCSISKISFPNIFQYAGEHTVSHSCVSGNSFTGNCSRIDANGTLKIYETTNPKGAERLPPGILVSESDLYQHRLWGNPDEDLAANKPRYLVAFAVGYGTMKNNVNNAVKKFAASENFTIILFHYDEHLNEWDEFDWSEKVIHIAARKQTKWWFAKRFLHPDIVAPYEYIFIWDEDLGVDNFNAEEYIKLVRENGLEISQPAVEAHGASLQWRMTERKPDQDIHKEVEERQGWCKDPHLPPCAGFVEIMAPVFSKNAWRCVWHMIQNDLVHGWGLDFSVRRCVEPSYEKMGIVDAQWIVHHAVPTLLNQGQAQSENSSSIEIRKRCRLEWKMFDERMEEAEKQYYQLMGITLPSSKSKNTTN